MYWLKVDREYTNYRVVYGVRRLIFRVYSPHVFETESFRTVCMFRCTQIGHNRSRVYTHVVRKTISGGEMLAAGVLKHLYCTRNQSVKKKKEEQEKESVVEAFQASTRRETQSIRNMRKGRKRRRRKN